MGKRKRSNGCEVMKIFKAEDRISDLPDVILCSILSLLTLRDVVKTSILSRRWRQLWKHTPHLNFTRKMFGMEQLYKYFRCCDEKSQDALLRERSSKILRLIHNILQCHMGFRVETFSVHFSLFQKYAQDLDQLISFAITSGTKELHLCLDDVDFSPSIMNEHYRFPFNFFSGGRGSSVKHLSLHFCALSLPPYFNGFSSLKSLDLKNVSVTETDIQNLVSSCLVLERLFIRSCHCLSNLKISNPGLQLKHLNVDQCLSLKKIELCDTNLVTIAYRGNLISLVIKNAPQLIRTYIYLFRQTWNKLGCFLSGLTIDLPQLETLVIHIPILKAEILPMSSNKFAHLKHLMLSLYASSETDFLCMVSLLNAAHFMESLELQLSNISKSKSDAKPREIRRRPSKSPHKHLKSIQINGFIGEINQIELAIYLLKNSPVLELISLNPANKECRIHDITSFYTIFPGNVQAAKAACRKASKYLLREISTNVKLVIL